jgi:hypothetical protein
MNILAKCSHVFKLNAKYAHTSADDGEHAKEGRLELLLAGAQHPNDAQIKRHRKQLVDAEQGEHGDRDHYWIFLSKESII